MDRIEIAGDRLEYLWVAPDHAAATIVLLHDSLGSIETWKDFPQALAHAAQRPVLVYSRAGHGRSAPLRIARAKDYLEHEAKIVLPALLEALGVTRPILFGHSDGATIALVCAGAIPQLPRAVIVEAPHVYVEPMTVTSVAAVKSAYADLRPRLAQYHDAPDAVFASWADVWTADWFRDWNVERYVDTITCPVLLIQGRADEYGSEAQLRSIARGRADRPILMLDDCGHAPHRDQRAAVLEATAEFLSTFAA